MASEYDFLQRIILSIGIGALIGLEREYSAKQQTTGIRSFALVAFLGCLSVLFSQSIVLQLPYEFVFLPYLGFVLVSVYSFLVFYFVAEKKERITITTTLALPLTFLFGMLVGFGFFAEAIIAAVLATILLYSRRYSHVFVEHLTETEIADALQFAIVLFLVYPLLPAEPITVFGLHLLLRRIAEIIIIVCLISFGGFLAIRLTGTKALPLTGFFGGLVSSLSVVGSFSNFSKSRASDSGMLSSGIFAACTASILSDAAILAYANAPLLYAVAPTFGALTLVLLAASLLYGRRAQKFELELSQPFSVKFAAKFALAFFVITILMDLLSGYDGGGALYVLSFIGGMVSVTPVVVSFALGAGTTVTYAVASHGILLAIIAGMLTKTAVLIMAASPDLSKRVVPILVISAAMGAAALLLTG